MHLHPRSLARHPLRHHVHHVVTRRRELRLGRRVDGDRVPLPLRGERRDGQYQQPLVHGVPMRRERRRVHGHLDVALPHALRGRREPEREPGAVPHAVAGDGRRVDRRPVGGQLRAEVRRGEPLDAHLGREVHAAEVVGRVGVAAGHEHGGVGEKRAGGVVHPWDVRRVQNAEPLAPPQIRRVQHRAQQRLPAEPPAGAALGGAVQHEQVAGGQDQHVAHDAARGHLVERPPRPGFRRVDARAVPERGRERAGLPELEGILGGAAADDDLRAKAGPFAEVQGQKRRHGGGRVVPGAAGEDRKLAYDLPGPVVEHDGAVVGEDEEGPVREEVDEGVQVVLHVVGGVPEQTQRRGPGVCPAGRRDELVAERASAADHDETAVREHQLRPVPARSRA